MRARAILGLVAVVVLAPACAGDDDADGGAATSAAVPSASARTTPTGPGATTTDGAGPASTAVAPADPPTTPSAVPPGAVQPEGFDRVQATITLADGTPCELCLWLADDAERRSRGLMHVTDLGAADGMAFPFGGPTTARFWMGNTPMPLSIAFFDAAGAFVSTADMEPCLSADDACPRYAATAPYATAIELPLGDVAALGVGPGSVLTLTDLPCA